MTTTTQSNSGVCYGESVKRSTSASPSAYSRDANSVSPLSIQICGPIEMRQAWHELLKLRTHLTPAELLVSMMSTYYKYVVDPMSKIEAKIEAEEAEALSSGNRKPPRGKRVAVGSDNYIG